MDALQALRTRRSVRAYDGRPVPREAIEQIADAGRLAATARNVQPWDFVAVTRREVLRQIADLTDYGKFIADAGACIVVLCSDTKYYLEDGSAAAQNLLVAAAALGVGSCWVAGDKKPYTDQILAAVHAPPGKKLVALVALGYPARTPASPPKRELGKVLHWEKF